MGDATGTTSFPGFERCIEFIRSGDSAVMEDGFWWLVDRASQYAPELMELVRTEQDPYVRGMFVELLGASHDERALPVLAAELAHSDPRVREWAVWALEDLGPAEALELAERYRAEHPEEWGSDAEGPPAPAAGAVSLHRPGCKELSVDEVPDRKRSPTRAGREALAARLGLATGPFSQDWEWEVADPARFEPWLAVYRSPSLSDDERFSLMEMLVQCVEDMAPASGVPEQIEELAEWQEVAALLRERPRLHASTIVYWSAFAAGDQEELFRVSVPMRRIWAEIRDDLA